MKTLRSHSGPFAERPYYNDEEIESICTDELRKVGLFPSSPEPIRIERFVEKRFGFSPTYDDLPKGVLGFTKFGSRGVEEIVVSRELADDGSEIAERRINTTLAHESGHGLLQTHLFVLDNRAQTASLFGDGLDEKQQKILCRTDSVQGVRDRNYNAGYDGRWWEYQANRAIGALLLPRSLVYEALDTILMGRGMLGTKILSPDCRAEAIQAMVETFEVNPIVARIRVDEIFPKSAEMQLTL